LIAVLIAVGSVSPGMAKKPPKPPEENSAGFSSVDMTLTTLDGVQFSSGVAWNINDPDLEVDQRSVVGSVWTVDYRAAYWDVSPGAKSLESTLVLLSGGQVATGINQQGEIVGCGTVDDRTVGLYWEHFFEDPLTLPPLSGHTTSEAYAINQNGVICGISSSDSTYDAVAWRIHELEGELLVFGPLRLGSTPSSGKPFDGTAAISLNDNVSGFAEIVGTGFRLPDSDQDAVAWKVAANFDGSLSVVDGPQLLEFGPYSSARGIDFQGDICGYSGDHAVVMNGSEVEQLPGPSNASGCFRAVDINDFGEVTGDGIVVIRKNLQSQHAVVWRMAEGSWTVTDLDDYFPRTLPGGSRAFAINNAGEVVGDVGSRPFLLVPK
jgi:uncharacterized membrane protein